MAENESLYLGTRDARRWDAVYDAVRKGQSSQNVARMANVRLHQALRKALKELAETGTPLALFLANRNSTEALRQLVKKSGNHEYAELFFQTVQTEKSSGNRGLLEAFVGAVWDTISDQIAQEVTGTERWPNFPGSESFLEEVRSRIEPAIDRIADKLAEDPSWMPVRKPEKNGTKVNPTTEMMSMSLLGIQSK